ncbi:MAG: signal peptidase II [Actinomycetaceae bacterium]|nr:signal peptidase II [Actinomycetaceae bacterium]
MVQNRSKLPYATFLLVGFFGLLSDYLTKEWALKTLKEGEESPLLGEIITLQLHFNPGAAFSSLLNATWIITVAATLVIVAMLYYMRRVDSYAWATALGFLLGGASGNLVDRLVREPGFGTGHVVDFLNYSDYFIGNVADIWIVVAAILIFGLALTNQPFQTAPKEITESNPPVKTETEVAAAGGDDE